MNSLLLDSWSWLARHFGTFGAAFILFYAGVLVLLLIVLAIVSGRRAWRSMHHRRELRVAHRQAYGDHPRGPYAA